MAKQKENPFKEMERSLLDVPANMKSKVMADVARARLVMDMASLFTCNYKSTIKESFKSK